jgi:hypothetical protein|uniref:hypothetical protein n=1 Tax=Enterocloster clostridioformis TaxID=1531 RepID=UPI00206AC2AD|nr:MAG TPA: Putative amidoligase enzyme [Caudoviricetes sp.]
MKEIMTNAESRKNVVKALAEHLGEKAVYAGPPSFAYRVGSITVDREGKIILEDESRAEEIEMVLAANGFLGGSVEEPDAEASYTGIRIPVGGLETQGIINLMNMLHAKQYLINKAVGQDGFSVSDSLITDLEAGTFQNAREVIDFIGNHGSSNTGFAFLEDTILFTGFPYTEEPAAVKAYTVLASKMVQSAGMQKRISPKPTIEENEKYYMRSWMVRIGLGGKDTKEERTFLLSGLKGHTAFRTPADEEKWKANRKATRAAAKEAAEETVTEVEEETAEEMTEEKAEEIAEEEAGCSE